MSFWRREPSDLAAKALGALGDRVEALEHQLRAHATSMAALEADSSLQWEKVNRAVGRLAKRDAAEAGSHLGEVNGPQSDEALNEIIRRGETPPWATHF